MHNWKHDMGGGHPLLIGEGTGFAAHNHSFLICLLKMLLLGELRGKLGCFVISGKRIICFFLSVQAAPFTQLES